MKGTEVGYAARGGMRIGLLFLAASALSVGLWALLSPLSFHEDFPVAGRHWVSALGPYNEHLVTDVGAGYLAPGVMLASAGILLGRTLVRVSLAAWLAFAVPHFAFHLTTLDAFSFADNLASMGVLGFGVMLPLLLLAATFGAARGDEPVRDRGMRKRRARI